MNDLFTYEYMLPARVRLLQVVSVKIWFTRFVPRKNTPGLTFMSTLYVYVIKLSIRPLRRMLIYLCIPLPLCERVRDQNTRPAAGIALGM